MRDEQLIAEGLRRTSIAAQQQQQRQPAPPPPQPPSQTLPPLVSVASAPSTIAAAPNQAASVVDLPFSSADPFMATTDFHSRQESADSGLGLGGNYTHPHTPEDFLNVMEDIDIASSEGERERGVLSLEDDLWSSRAFAQSLEG